MRRCSQMFPDVFSTVEFRRIARQPDEGDVCGHAEAVAAVVARAIEEDGGVGASLNGLADGFEVQVHHGGIGFGHNDGRTCRPAGTSGTEEIGPVAALDAADAPAGGDSRGPPDTCRRCVHAPPRPTAL